MLDRNVVALIDARVVAVKENDARKYLIIETEE